MNKDSRAFQRSIMLLRTMACLVLLPTFTFCLNAQEGNTSSSGRYTAAELYQEFSGAVFLIESLDSGGKVIGIGSGVAISREQVITNYHVTESARSLRVRNGEAVWAAEITHAFVEEDLCRLRVPGLVAKRYPEVRQLSKLQVGEKVFAIGNPEGFERTISEGLISGIRKVPLTRIQTTAQISQGSSGGGLFDEYGRLVGITAAFFRSGQNINFAIPTDAITGLDSRPFENNSKAAISRRINVLAPEIIELTERQNFEAARQRFLEFVELVPEAWAWDGLGSISRLAGRTREALVAHHKAVQMEPRNASYWRNLGYAHEESGHLAAAMEAFERSLSLDGNDALAWAGKAYVLCRRGQNESAMPIYERLLRLDPEVARLVRYACFSR